MVGSITETSGIFVLFGMERLHLKNLTCKLYLTYLYTLVLTFVFLFELVYNWSIGMAVLVD